MAKLSRELTQRPDDPPPSPVADVAREIEQREQNAPDLADLPFALTPPISKRRCTLCDDDRDDVREEREGTDGQPLCDRCFTSSIEHGHEPRRADCGCCEDEVCDDCRSHGRRPAYV